MSEQVVPITQRCLRDINPNQYTAVSVCCGEGACSAARAIAGKRHLLEAAPQLPLPQCTAKTCTCRLFRYGDRRSLLTNRRSHGPGQGRRGAWVWRKNRRAGNERRRLKIDFRRWA